MINFVSNSMSITGATIGSRLYIVGTIVGAVVATFVSNLTFDDEYI